MSIFSAWGGEDKVSNFANSTITLSQAHLNGAIHQLQDQAVFMSPNMHFGGHFIGGRGHALRSAHDGDKQMAYQEMQGLKTAAVPVIVKDEKKSESAVATLKELGFDNLHQHASRIAERAMKENLIGLAGYKKIPAAKFHEARQRVQHRSEYSLDLLLTPVKKYMGQNIEITPGGTVTDQEISLPPQDVLQKMASAKKEGLFDKFAVIHVAKVNDPILVGQVNGSEDLYFIAEWGNDISLEEMMK